MERIYFDQAATSFPKGEQVAGVMGDYLRNVGVNINRGGYMDAYETAGMIYETREKLCRFFDFGPLPQMAKNVIFTSNITYALNMLIKGFLKKKDHVLVSQMEHNAIMRPLVQLEKAGIITFDRIPCNNRGELLLEAIEPLIKVNTRAIYMTHASNVCGTILPAQKVGEIAHRHNLKFILDSAQTAGTFPISMKEMHLDALAFTGHKGLLGPQGIGGFLVTDEMAEQMEALICGGTGSISDTEETPEFLPDKFEAGTPNIPGILGLAAGIDTVEKIGLDNIRKKEEELTAYFLKEIKEISQLKIIGKEDIKERSFVVSVQTIGMDESTMAFLLDSQYHILTRVGMHCAPNAHKTLGTFPEGTLRFSFGYHNTKDEIDTAIRAIKTILA